MTNKRDISIYVHWPFCLSLCPYCDFNSHIYNGIDEGIWIAAYKREIDFFASTIKGKRIKSIFFGGGTPSLMSPLIADAIIDRLASFGLLDKNTEITLEANPTSYEQSKFRSFKDVGINRVSIGVQSLNDTDLRKLGRKHSVSDAIDAIKSAASIFDRFSFDLIYARSDQTPKAWQFELRSALELATDHVSLYQLTIERGTEFFSMYKAGKLSLPQDDDSARMYEITEAELDKKGFHRYEISNYAKAIDVISPVPRANIYGAFIDGFNIEQNYCQHNMTYWRYGEYLGIGPGAHSRLHHIRIQYAADTPRVDRRAGAEHKQPIGIEAIMMYHKPDKWLDAVKESGHGIQRRNPLTEIEVLDEIVMMALRLREGLYNKMLMEITGRSITDVIDLDLARSYEQGGFLEITYKDCHLSLVSTRTGGSHVENIRLTNSGLLMHSYITARLIRPCLQSDKK